MLSVAKTALDGEFVRELLKLHFRLRVVFRRHWNLLMLQGSPHHDEIEMLERLALWDSKGGSVYVTIYLFTIGRDADKAIAEIIAPDAEIETT